MGPRIPQIVALGGGGFSMEKDGSLLDDDVRELRRVHRLRREMTGETHRLSDR